MQAPKVMTGVWVTGFEETSFFSGASAIPDRNEPRRLRVWLEVDGKRVSSLVRRELEDPYHHAIRLTFVGRQSKYPLSIDCYGGRYYLVVADWVVTARYLGRVANADPPPLPSKLPPHKPFKPSGEGGVIAQLEKEALARCGDRSQPSRSR